MLVACSATARWQRQPLQLALHGCRCCGSPRSLSGHQCAGPRRCACSAGRLPTRVYRSSHPGRPGRAGAAGPLGAARPAGVGGLGCRQRGGGGPAGLVGQGCTTCDLPRTASWFGAAAARRHSGDASTCSRMSVASLSRLAVPALPAGRPLPAAASAARPAARSRPVLRSLLGPGPVQVSESNCNCVEQPVHVVTKLARRLAHSELV